MEIREMKLDFGADERVGSYLRRIREGQGLELEQLSKAIRLGKNVLQEIEDNKWDSFPTEAYLRSYIASICDKLSLDKKEVLKRFSAEIDSHFGVAQANIVNKNEQLQESSSSNASKIIIAVILVIVVAAFFVLKTLEEEDSFKNHSAPEEILLSDEELDIIISVDEEADADSQAEKDSIPASASNLARDPNAKDTIRFECTPSATDETCGISLKGFDSKMNYFKRMLNRHINHHDTAQITITVPERTRLFINGSKLEYGKINTLLFYEGKIISKSNRELR